MSNAYIKLKQILPPAPVLVGLVTEHHEEDDTSTVVLPTNEGVIEYAAGVAIGSTIRARGTNVAVGEKAFVRNGVIETRAPDGDAIEIEIGRVVPPTSPVAFSGPIYDQLATDEYAFSLPLASYFSGGVPPLAFSMQAGTLPVGLSLSSAGLLSGTPSAAGATSGLVVKATDQTGAWAVSNAFGIDVADQVLFTGTIADQSATEGEAFSLALASHWSGGVAPLSFSLQAGTLPAGLSLSDAGLLSGTPSSVGSSSGLVVKATDQIGASANGNAFGIVVASAAVRWLAQDSDTYAIYYSDDEGTTWTATGYSFANVVWACWGNGLFVAGVYSNTTNNIYTSPDGITWTQRTVSNSGRRTSAVWNGSIFVVGSQNTTNRVSTSPDGITWTPRSVPVSTTSNLSAAVHWAEDLFVLTVQAAASKAATSPDGVNWTAAEPPVLTAGAGYARATLKIGSTYSMLPQSPTPKFLTTSGFGSFTETTNGSTNLHVSAYSSSLASNGSVWVCAGLSGLYTTTDGTTFTLRRSGNFLCVHWTGHKFVAIGTSEVVVSANGAAWTTKSSPFMFGTGVAVAHY